MKGFWRVLSGAVLTCIGGVGAILFAGGSSLQWFANLKQPALVPAEWTFVPLWLALYVLMIAALSVIWTTEPHTSEREGWVRFYFVQLVFNGMWVILFFGLHSILVSLIDMLFLAFIVSGLIASGWEIDKRASYLLAPYFACTLFFAYLNLNIWLIN